MKVDLSVLADQTEGNSKKITDNEPIGETTEYTGTLEEIKKLIAADWELAYKSIEKNYWANNG